MGFREIVSKKRQSIGRVFLDGNCEDGKIIVQSKTGKKIGELSYYDHAWDIERGRKTRAISVSHIVVDPKYQGIGVSKVMYSRLCKLIKEECPLVHTFSGDVVSKRALKTRTEVFGAPRHIWYQDVAKIKADENYHGEYISYNKALTVLPDRRGVLKSRRRKRLDDKGREYYVKYDSFDVAGTGNWVTVVSNVKDCRDDLF